MKLYTADIIEREMKVDRETSTELARALFDVYTKEIPKCRKLSKVYMDIKKGNTNE